jgi:hypothetical protein
MTMTLRHAQDGRRRAPALAYALAACAALALLSLLAPSTPTYDPWAWLVWGREVAALDLDTTAGPAWKPLPVAVAALLAPLGDAAPEAWLVIARAGALAACVMAWRVASRLAGGSRAAGAVAFAGMALTSGWLWHGALGNSEGLLVVLALGALDRALDGRHRQALLLGLACALLRTEAWPFLAAYAIWAWRERPATRPIAGAAAVLLPAAWFLPDLLTAGDALRSSARARVLEPGAPGLAGDAAVTSLGRAAGLPLAGLAAAAVFTGWLAWARRAQGRRLLLACVPGAAGLAWMLVVALMSELGYSGEPRYALPGAALLAVTGAVGLAAALAQARRPAVRAAVLAGVALLVALPAGMRLRDTADDVERLGFEARLYTRLDEAVAAAGGRDAVLACPPAHVGRYAKPALAWQLGVPLAAVTTRPASSGTVVSARPTAALPPEPRLRRDDLRTVARAGEWRVLSSCGSPR